MHITEGYELSKIKPGYRSQSGSKYSKIESTSSLAIMSLYQKLFSNSKTKFSGPYILGWDKNKLLEAFLEGIQFCPFAIKIKNLIVYVTSLGIESNINIIEAAIRYISSFIGEFKKKHALFVQAIEKNNSEIVLTFAKLEGYVVMDYGCLLGEGHLESAEESLWEGHLVFSLKNSSCNCQSSSW
ncbi:35909_t:CDS:2 [Gigaspora margarita]|uniref:35909_t:CDS:1 n=1 Tax=Gigaspora margarita TaxID=4874 RepID=A0ABN7V8P6_GIGMA|nr:35909_t:CDS:2 [Gigaspora margarita]